MKGWLLDTNVIAEISGKKPDPSVLNWATAQHPATLFLSILTIAEFEKGINHLPELDPRRPGLRARLIALEERFAGRILSLSDATIRRWGAISGEVLRTTKQMPDVIDTMLAATAIEKTLYFVTRNTKHVTRSGAVAFNPWTDDPDKFPLIPK